MQADSVFYPRKGKSRGSRFYCIDFLSFLAVAETKMRGIEFVRFDFWVSRKSPALVASKGGVSSSELELSRSSRRRCRRRQRSQESDASRFHSLSTRRAMSWRFSFASASIFWMFLSFSRSARNVDDESIRRPRWEENEQRSRRQDQKINPKIETGRQKV